MKRTKLADRSLPDYTTGEEIFNMVSHAAGGLFAVVALVLCVTTAFFHHNAWGVATGAIYGATMVLLYTMSSVYHGVRGKGTAKKVLQIIDHCSIFLLIAGCYTPLTLGLLRPEYPVLAWAMFAAVWASAVIGATLNAIDLKRYAVFSMICYLCSGWCIVVSVKPLLAVMPVSGFVLLIAGGVAYSFGAVLYGLGRTRRYMHSVFHLFVVAGSVLHFLCILLYVM